MNRPETRTDASDAPITDSDSLVTAPCFLSEHLYMLPLQCAATTASAAPETTAKHGAAPISARWQITVLMLLAPLRTTRVLIEQLERLPTTNTRHELPDDCRRRFGAGRRTT